MQDLFNADSDVVCPVACLTCVCPRVKGGYRALDMGFPHEAMVDMTGGVTETFSTSRLTRDPPAFLSQLLAKGALINCANCQVRERGG